MNETQGKRLLDALFGSIKNEAIAETEPEDNYPETTTEKVGYSEFVVIHALQNISPALQRLTRLHRLLMVAEKSGESQLPDVITLNEVKMALNPLLQIENDIKEVNEMLAEVYRATKTAVEKSEKSSKGGQA